MDHTLSLIKGRISYLWGKLEGHPLSSGILAFVIVISLTVTFTRDVPQWFDLTISDDSDYMAGGLHLGADLANDTVDWNPDWAPLYRLWFFALAGPNHDAEGMFYISLRLLGMLVPVLLYLVLRRSRVSPLVAAGVSLLFLTTYANWFPEPHVMNFALLVLLIVWWSASLFPQRWQRLWVFAVLSLFVAYVRPEFFMATILLVVIAAAYLFYSLRKRRIQLSTPDKAFIAGLTGVFILFFLWWGIPFSDDRSIYAFGQHYAANVSTCFGAKDLSGLSWEGVLARDFGNPDGIFQAYRNNPGAFQRHIFCNLKKFPKQFLSVTFTNAWTSSWLLIKLCLAVVLWRLVFHWRAIRAQIKWLWEKDMLLLGLVSLIPAGLSVFLIYPREHYVAFFSLMAFALTTMAVGVYETDASKQLAFRKTLVGGLLLLAFFPSMGGLFDNQTPQKPIQTTVHEIRALHADASVRILATHPFQTDYAQVYFDDGFTALPFKPYDVPFSDFLLEHDPNVILVARDGLEFKDDPTWEEFKSNYQADGFREIVLKAGDAWGPWRLYVKDDLGN